MSWVGLPPFIGHYNFIKTVGCGTFSVVKEAVDELTNERVAIKCIPKSKLSTASDIIHFKQEVKVVLMLDHPGIIKIRDFLVDPLYYYVITDYCSGGTLLEQNIDSDSVDEEYVKQIFKQILETVCYMHEQKVAHRDLKLENIMLDDYGQIKLVDFGFSKHAEQDHLFSTPCGSPAYAAPEIIDGKKYNGMEADMWSCGVILFTLLTGSLPWSGRNQMSVFKQIREGKVIIPAGVGTHAAALITNLMQNSPEKRMTARQALLHPWFNGISINWDTHITRNVHLSEIQFDEMINPQRIPSSAPVRANPRELLETMTQRAKSLKLRSTSYIQNNKKQGQLHHKQMTQLRASAMNLGSAMIPLNSSPKPTLLSPISVPLGPILSRPPVSLIR